MAIYDPIAQIVMLKKPTHIKTATTAPKAISVVKYSHSGAQAGRTFIRINAKKHTNPSVAPIVHRRSFILKFIKLPPRAQADPGRY
jgi:hypothetical protein